MIKIIHGDCLEVMRTLDAESIDAAVTDPPYHLTSIVKRFGTAAPSNMHSNTQPEKRGAHYKRLSAGFMGQTWDGGDIAFRPETWAAVARVMKPGAHLLAFCGTRTYHRLACAIEDAGFEVRDCILWHYASGFPKSHDISKAIDRMAGAEREIVGVAGKSGSPRSCIAGDFTGGDYFATAPATDAARQWAGWGTALKPACEIICVARKPLSEKTIAANVLKHGTGALNIDACRVGGGGQLKWEQPRDMGYHGGSDGGPCRAETNAKGRWPANLVHDGSDEVLAEFAKYGESKSSDKERRNDEFKSVAKGRERPHSTFGHADSGTAARFFYTAKAGAEDRLGSKHPTVKPVSLMRWLVKLVTPPNGTVLDPFAGSGTTGMACMAEGFNAVLIEQSAEYCADIRKRIEHVRGCDTPLFSMEE